MYTKPSNIPQLQRQFKHGPKPKSEVSFGPSLSKSKPLEMKGQIKKLIHYDCRVPGDNGEGDDDIPDEDEVYVKENLLFQKKDETNTE